MKKRMMTALIAAIMAMAIATTSFAAGWQRNPNGWWWQNQDGSWPANCWQWLDGNNDGIAECYYFDGNGYLLVNTVTPDGYQVNGDGAWVLNNVVQTKQVGPNGTVAPSYSSSSSYQAVRDGWYWDGPYMKYRLNGKYLKNTWRTIGGDKYYFDSEGYAVTGFHTINGKTYYFNGDGTLRIRSFSRNGYYYVVPKSNGVITDVIDDDELDEWEFYEELLYELF